MTTTTDQPGPAPGDGTTRRRGKAAPTPPAPATPPVVRRWDWTAWQHGPIAAPLQSGAGLASAAMVGDLTHVAPAWGAGVGVAATVAVSIRAAARDISPLGLAGRAACWLTAGGWMTWALHTSAWAPNVLAALTGGTLAAALAAPPMADHEARVQARGQQARDDEASAAAAAEAAQQRLEVAKEWEARLLRVTKIADVKIVAVETWPGDIGYTLEAVFPPGGLTYQQLRDHAPGLAGDACLPHGCAVEVEPGMNRGRALIKVGTVDTTSVALPYPQDYPPLSYNDLHPIGMHGGGVEARVDHLNTRTMATGQIGSGKTNLLQVINAGLVRCPDVLKWHIDLNGSGMSAPWLEPWLDGRASRPVIDWVAPTIDEAVLMLTVAGAIARGRKTAYKALMIQVNDDKIPISISLPGIEITLDEGAEAVAMNRGDKRLTVALESLIATSRAARLGTVVSGVRATADIMPPALQAQSGTRIVMRPSDTHEAAQLLGWGVQKMINEAAVPGEGLMLQPGAGIRKFMAYRLAPQQIAEIAIACASRQPVLDQPSAKLAGRVYAERWDRYRDWRQSQGGDTLMPPTPRTPSDPEQPGPADQTGQPNGRDLDPRFRGVAGLANASANLDAAMDRLRKFEAEKLAENAARDDQTDQTERAGQTEQAGQPDAGEVDAAFDELVAGQTFTADEVLGQILAAAGPDGISVTDIDTEMKRREVASPPSRATLYRRLAERGDVHQPVDGKWAIRPAD